MMCQTVGAFVEMIIPNAGGLVVKHVALCAKNHRFDPIKSLKLFQGIISQPTTSWVADHVKWHCHLHWINFKKGALRPPEDVIHSGTYHPQYFSSIFLYCSLVSGGGGDISNHSIKGTTLEISACTFMCDPCFIITDHERKTINHYRYHIKINSKFRFHDSGHGSASGILHKYTNIHCRTTTNRNANTPIVKMKALQWLMFW